MVRAVFRTPHKAECQIPVATIAPTVAAAPARLQVPAAIVLTTVHPPRAVAVHPAAAVAVAVAAIVVVSVTHSAAVIAVAVIAVAVTHQAEATEAAVMVAVTEDSVAVVAKLDNGGFFKVKRLFWK